MLYLLKRIFIFLLPSGVIRTKWIEKWKIFNSTGKNFYFCPRKIPADPKLIKFKDNVAVATDVMFINHDVSQKVFNSIFDEDVPKFFGCIEVGNNVFIGAKSIILPNVKICDNVYIAAGAVVAKSITESGIWGGCPAKRIGDVNELYKQRLIYKNSLYNENKEKYNENLWKEFYKIQNEL